MAKRIPDGIKDVAQLGSLVDRELQRVEASAKQGYVGRGRVASEGESYFFVDNGVLKFFNASTKQTKTVNVS